MRALFHAAALAVFASLVLLCAWQVERHRVSQNSLAKHTQALLAPIKQITAHELARGALPSSQRLRLTGRFASARPFLSFILGTGKGKSAGPGYRALAPLVLSSAGSSSAVAGVVGASAAANADTRPTSGAVSALIWVDLGFVRESDGERMLLNTKSELSLVGVYRPPPRANLFTPAHVPTQNWWAIIDPAAKSRQLLSALAEARNYTGGAAGTLGDGYGGGDGGTESNSTINDGTVFHDGGYLHILPVASEQADRAALSDVQAVADAPTPRRRRHLEYAFTWGGLALMWATCYLLLLSSKYKRRRRRASKALEGVSR